MYICAYVSIYESVFVFMYACIHVRERWTIAMTMESIARSFLYDIFARVGGRNDPSDYQVSTDIMVQLNTGNVVLDNAWLWRADHDISGLVYKSMNPVSHGLQVRRSLSFSLYLSIYLSLSHTHTGRFFVLSFFSFLFFLLNTLDTTVVCLRQVNAPHVTAYGLAVEHTLRDLVQWNGDHGRVYFYQSELPYDVSQTNFGTALSFSSFVL
jgi:hypothetical protein